MAKITFKLDTLNFWVLEETKLGFIVGSEKLQPFFKSHADVEQWLLSINAIGSDDWATITYADFLRSDKDDINQALNEYLTLFFNNKPRVLWPVVLSRLSASVAPMPVEDRYEHQQRFSAPTIEERELF